MRPAMLDKLACLRSVGTECRNWLVTNTADAALHAATVHTLCGVEVLCGSIRRVTASKPTAQVVCALGAGAFCSALSLLSLGICTVCTLVETAARLAKRAAAAAAEGSAYAATLGGDLGTSGLGLARVDPTLALPLLPPAAPLRSGETGATLAPDAAAPSQGDDAG